MKYTLALVLVFATVAFGWTPPPAPTLGTNFSYLSFQENYDKISGAAAVNSGWVYGDNEKQALTMITITKESNTGILLDFASQKYYEADFYSQTCSSGDANLGPFPGPNYLSAFKYIGTEKRPEFEMCGVCDGFEVIANDTVSQMWFITGTNIPCFRKFENNDMVSAQWYMKFMYNTPYGHGAFGEECPFGPSAPKHTAIKPTSPVLKQFSL